MSTIRLMVNSDIYKCDWEFERRMNVIRGDSGIGKTTLVEILTNRPQGIEIYTTLPTVTVLENSWRSVLAGVSDSIILFDDIVAVESADFANMYKESVVDKNNYVIAISRENQFQPGSMGRLPFSINAMYEEITNGIEHDLKPLYRKNFMELPKEADCCIVEDSGAGFQFFSELFTIPVISSKPGKSAMVSALVNAAERYRNILLIFDTAAFGCHMEQLVSVINELDIHVYFMSSYECFEELLTVSNLLFSKQAVVNEYKDLPTFANRFISWERYFENLAARAGYGCPYEYNHDSKMIKFCYIHDCSECNPYIMAKCDSRLSGEKFAALLKGTKYENLLRFGKKETYET